MKKTQELLDKLNKLNIGEKLKVTPQLYWAITSATLEIGGQLDLLVGWRRLLQTITQGETL